MTAYGKSNWNRRKQKTKPDPFIKRPLIGHCLDVAHLVREMLSRGVSRARVSLLCGFDLTDVHVERLAFWAGLHDFGKANHVFQAKLDDPKVKGSHLKEAFALIEGHDAGKTLLNEVDSWFEHPDEFFQVLLGHHGGPIAYHTLADCVDRASTLWDATAEYDPVAEVHALFDALRRAFPKAEGQDAPRFPKKANNFHLSHLLAGLIQAADKIASIDFPLLGPNNRPALAKQRLDEIGWSDWGEQVAPLLTRPPRPLQVKLSEEELERLIIVEAPTGDGKTEGAEIVISRLINEGVIDGAVLAAPLRSAATELFKRLQADFTAAYPRLKGKCALAISGAKTERSDDDTLPMAWDSGTTPRVAQAPLIVGTIDQPMLSVMRVRDAWMRSWLLNRHLLIIDEVHATDAYMTEIVAALVKRHLARGGYVMLMSATLGEEMAHRVLKRERLSFEKAVARRYPCITFGSGREVEVKSYRTKTVHTTIASVERCIDRVLRLVQDGGVGLWICSTVQDAVRTAERLRARGIEVLLHHSRFTVADRKALDDTVTEWIGGKGHRRPGVIVSTQTCEQSLDIDADLLVSEPCPADVLVQRFGRIARQESRSHLEPEAWIIDPEADCRWDRYLSSEGKRLGDRHRWAWVYDPLCVRATIEWLIHNGPTVVIPRDAREFVEAASHEEVLYKNALRYGEKWTKNFNLRQAKQAALRSAGSDTLINDSLAYCNGLVDDAHATRIGLSNVTIEVAGLLKNCFSSHEAYSETIQVPYHWLGSKFTPKATAHVFEVDDQGSIIEVRDGSAVLELRYDRYGLNRISELAKWNLL